MGKVELLAPAGSYESFLGAIHAGADAVYLGGQKFGARAYADNFTEEEVCKAIRYAHIYGRKVYLTLNTLVKTREFDEIYDYVKPFYLAGLDGIIIQDLGVFQAIGEYFPGLERHVSTQMTITGAQGALYLKKLGATRIVPARELSVKEIKEMKAVADIEIETFIHGAICYCYSGQCLFSSLIGGRSGNRGRCAQPCRLPYRMEKSAKEQFPLSLKDMCTVAMVPELVEAGIDSFKIEGRMKSPEYAAGVTAIYRKYIDRYYANPKGEYKVEAEDMEKLRTLYIRSEISEGYYHKHNGVDMITLDSPSYAGRDDKLAEQIRKDYLEADYRLPVRAEAVLHMGEKARLTLSKGEIGVTAEGECVQAAQKQPLTEESARKQLNKLGNTSFQATDWKLDMESQVFLPVKALNELRRKACELLEDKLIESYGLSYRREEPVSNAACVRFDESDKRGTHDSDEAAYETNYAVLHVSVLTKEQAMAAVNSGAKRIYLASELCRDRKWLNGFMQCCMGNVEVYLALPYVMRQRDEKFKKEMEELLCEKFFTGVLVRNIEEIGWLESAIGELRKKELVTDAGLYIWNPKAEEVFGIIGKEHYIPYELNLHEIKELTEQTKESAWSMTVYGRLPMMVTANCIAKTGGGCRLQKGEPTAEMSFERLTDRYQKQLPVYVNCAHCYNVIYNSLPLSLHQNLEKIRNAGIRTFRLDFTTENGNDVDRIIHYYKEKLQENEIPLPYEEYTKGHLKRGVE